MKKNRALWRRTVAIAAIGVVVVAVWRYEAATPAQAASSGTAATTMASAQPGTQPIRAGTGAATLGPESGGSTSTRCADCAGPLTRMPK